MDVREAGGLHPAFEVRPRGGLDAVFSVGFEAGEVAFLADGAVHGAVGGGSLEAEVDEFGVAAGFGGSAVSSARCSISFWVASLLGRQVMCADLRGRFGGMLFKDVNLLVDLTK